MTDAPATNKDAPKTFPERGVAVPFTTAELLFARVRQKGETRELLVPGLAETRGIFVYEWSGMRNRFTLSLHDRLLHRQLTIAPPPTPDTVASLALKIARGGSAGGETLAASEDTVKQGESFPALARFALTRRLIERLGADPGNLTPEEMALEDGQRRAIDMLGGVSHVYGLAGPQLYTRIETLGSLLGRIGVGGMSVEPPNRRLVERLKLLARTLSAWADTGGSAGDGVGEAHLIGRVAAETARLAGNTLERIDRETLAVDALMAGWNDRIEELRGYADRIVWFLDGWDRLLGLWQNVASKDRGSQAKALTLMSYVVPMIPAGEIAADERATWDEMNDQLAKLIAASEEGVALSEMLELMGPEAQKPSGLTGTSARARPSRGGLPEAKLGQVVRLLESVVERPDGAPARKMLDELRPQISMARPPRLPRARRAVCAVFEEMLVDGETTSKTGTRIPRSAIMPVWSLFLERADKAKLAELEKDLAAPQNIAEIRRMFATRLKPDLDDAAAYTSKARTLIVRLGGEAHYHGMQLMVGAVTIAEQLMNLRAQLPPKPIADFREADLDNLAAALNEIRKIAADQIQTALSIVMGQMAQPWKISNVLEVLATSGRFRSSAGISGFVTAAMIGQIDGKMNDVRKLADAMPVAGTTTSAGTPAPVGEAAMALAESISQCADNIVGTTAALQVSGSPTQIEEVDKMRQKLCELVESKVGGSAASVLVGAFSIQEGKGQPRWRFDRPLNPAGLFSAEQYATALKRSETSAAQLGIGERVSASVKETLEDFEKYVSRLFAQMRETSLGLDQREIALTHVAAAARVIEILAGTERAERFYLRGLESVG